MNFNSHAHVERDDIRSFVSTAYTHFNSHAHVERDEREVLFSLRRRDFNSHAHVERDSLVIESSLLYRYFNSHAHVERDLVNTYYTQSSIISTHTLTWSVTIVLAALLYFVSFQLTRSRGA